MPDILTTMKESIPLQYAYKEFEQLLTAQDSYHLRMEIATTAFETRIKEGYLDIKEIEEVCPKGVRERLREAAYKGEIA